MVWHVRVCPCVCVRVHMHVYVHACARRSEVDVRYVLPLFSVTVL